MSHQWLKLAAAMGAAVALSGCSPSSTLASTPAPTVTVTATATVTVPAPGPTVTVTATRDLPRDVPVTPAVCIDALAKADIVANDFNQVVSTSQEALAATNGRGNPALMQDATTRLNAIPLGRDESAYEAAAALCRSSR